MHNVIGKVKSIGVSNFSVKTLNELLPHCTVVPATNQVELHPCLPSFELKAFCDEKGILLTAYSPLGRCRYHEIRFMSDNLYICRSSAQRSIQADFLHGHGCGRHRGETPGNTGAGRH